MANESSSATLDQAATAQVSPGSITGEDSPVGRRISRYVVLRNVGSGAMGRVMQAYDPKLQREVAIKEVLADVCDDAATERMLVEARAMAELSHPNVVSVYDVELLDDDRVALVMEFIEGQTLRDWLQESSRSWLEVVGVFSAAGRGLVAAHEAGLLHRDFKPANVLVSSTGEVKVIDFGLARQELQDSAGHSRETHDANARGAAQAPCIEACRRQFRSGSASRPTPGALRGASVHGERDRGAEGPRTPTLVEDRPLYVLRPEDGELAPEVQGVLWGEAAGRDESLYTSIVYQAPGCSRFVPGTTDWAFCSADCPCDVGMGDCDSDAECRSGLVCAHDYGPLFGQPPPADVCMYPSAL